MVKQDQLNGNGVSFVENVWLEHNQKSESNNKAIIKNDFWSYGEYELVGHGKQTSPKCGTFNKFMGCLNYKAHNQTRYFNEALAKDSIFVKPIYHSCDKPSCPVCFKYGWAVREAYRMEERLKVASNRFGLPVEHIVVSIKSEDYGLTVDALRKKAVRLMANRGIIGGSIIFHGFRYANRKEAQKKGVPFWLALESSFSCSWFCWW